MKKEIKEKLHLLDNQVITRENVQELGEKLAMSAISGMKRFEGRRLDSLQKGLLNDVFHYSNNRLISDGYDIAQECICFLCHYIDKPLGTKCINQYGKPDTVRIACYKIARSYIRKELKKQDMDSIEYMVITDEECIQTEEDYTRVRKIQKLLNLTKEEKALFEYMVENVMQKSIAEFLKVSTKTIRKRMNSIRQKYFKVFN